MKMIILLIVVGFGLMIFGINEGTHRSVYGKQIPESELDEFLSKHLSEYELNTLDINNRIFWNISLPYIARSPAFLTTWHISGWGTISRWSKWSEKLDAYRDKLVAFSSTSLS